MPYQLSLTPISSTFLPKSFFFLPDDYSFINVGGRHLTNPLPSCDNGIFAVGLAPATAEITFRSGVFTIHDVASGSTRDGTLINGDALRSTTSTYSPTILEDGDRLDFGYFDVMHPDSDRYDLDPQDFVSLIACKVVIRRVPAGRFNFGPGFPPVASTPRQSSSSSASTSPPSTPSLASSASSPLLTGRAHPSSSSTIVAISTFAPAGSGSSAMSATSACSAASTPYDDLLIQLRGRIPSSTGTEPVSDTYQPPSAPASHFQQPVISAASSATSVPTSPSELTTVQKTSILSSLSESFLTTHPVFASASPPHTPAHLPDQDLHSSLPKDPAGLTPVSDHPATATTRPLYSTADLALARVRMAWLDLRRDALRIVLDRFSATVGPSPSMRQRDGNYGSLRSAQTALRRVGIALRECTAARLRMVDSLGISASSHAVPLPSCPPHPPIVDSGAPCPLPFPLSPDATIAKGTDPRQGGTTAAASAGLLACAAGAPALPAWPNLVAQCPIPSVTNHSFDIRIPTAFAYSDTPPSPAFTPFFGSDLHLIPGLLRLLAAFPSPFTFASPGPGYYCRLPTSGSQLRAPRPLQFSF
ncbi:hypothetical protein CF319_g5001 [Tilletia indica]|nr:hypothetical protein CF319_g5001 [Tilletia indica]